LQTSIAPPSDEEKAAFLSDQMLEAVGAVMPCGKAIGTFTDLTSRIREGGLDEYFRLRNELATASNQGTQTCTASRIPLRRIRDRIAEASVPPRVKKFLGQALADTQRAVELYQQGFENVTTAIQNDDLTLLGQASIRWDEGNRLTLDVTKRMHSLGEQLRGSPVPNGMAKASGQDNLGTLPLEPEKSNSTQGDSEQDGLAKDPYTGLVYHTFVRDSYSLISLSPEYEGSVVQLDLNTIPLIHGGQHAASFFSGHPEKYPAVSFERALADGSSLYAVNSISSVDGSRPESGASIYRAGALVITEDGDLSVKRRWLVKVLAPVEVPSQDGAIQKVPAFQLVR
jgi:hypothetical protein